MLINRPMLCVFRASYDFCRKHYRVRRTLWRSVYEELRAAAGLMPLARCDWRIPWSPTVGVSDATLHGYSAMEADWTTDQVSQVGAWSERWRFRLGAGKNPRTRAALSAARESLNDEDGEISSVPLGDAFYKPHPEVELWCNGDFLELPANLAKSTDWKLIQA